ncbi:BQ2448_211 [Microbotryum intermedium]|uniref:BQ2448_211 protein n=1 Tax=Microbotryum intermedium TaxID=269621 RepID=A0A238F1U0_9BASI|nr:BQ2448_211 [Microbotryum intermedium]
MSRTPSAAPSSSTAPGSTASVHSAASDKKPSGTKANAYAVSDIPAFRAPTAGINYAQAASKSKPSPPALHGKDAPVSGTFGGASPSIPAATAMANVAATGSSPAVSSTPAGGHMRNQSVKVDAINVQAFRVDAITTGAADGAFGSVALLAIAFGNVNDRNAVLSSSPAAPPPASNGNPKTFGTVPTASSPAAAAKAPINLHSFFTGSGAAASPSPASLPATSASDRRPNLGYDASRPSQNSSPSTTSQHLSQLSSASASFAPRQQAPPFIPGQQQQHSAHLSQGSFPSPSLQFAHLPTSSSFSQTGYGPKSPAMQSANVGQYSPGPSGGAPAQRNGSFTGASIAAGRPNVPGNRASFGNVGPTSPRMQNSTLPPQQAPYGPQTSWQQSPYGQQQYGYYGMQFPPQNVYVSSQQGGPNVTSSLPPSGSSTPASIRPPAPAATATPGLAPSPSPSPSHSTTPTAPHYSAYSSPQPQPALQPHHASFRPSHPSASGTPLRALASAALAPEFKPNADAAVWTPRKSAAIQIRDPKKEAAAAAAATTTPKASEAAGAKAEKSDAPSPAPTPAKESTPTEEVAKNEAPATPAAGEKPESKKPEVAEAAVVKDEPKTGTTPVDAKSELAVVEQHKKVDEKEDEPVTGVESTPEPVTNGKELLPKEESLVKAVEAKSGDVRKDGVPSVPAVPTASSPAPAPQSAPVTDEKTLASPGDALAKARFAERVPAGEASTPTSSAPAASANSAVETSEEMPAAGASTVALSEARKIDDLASVSYPDDIQSPKAELNVNAESGRYRYDREFLMQFMNVCTEKPESLPNLEAIGMVDAGAEAGSSRGNFGAGNRRAAMGPPAVPGRSAGPAAGFGTRSASAGGVGAGFGSMGSFGQAPLGTSEARFAQSSMRAASGAFGGGRAGNMSRTTSQSGVPGGAFVPAAPSQTGRIRSERGKRREEPGRAGGDRGHGGGGKHTAGDGFENATLAPRSETGWVPTVIGGAPALDANSPELVQRKVKALLNKLTLERFESISNQILEWADKSVTETDGRILRQVIALIFEKATDEANWSEMYARLCRKLMETVSMSIKDESVKSADGSFVVGGALFRKYLLNRCQEDYESGWKLKETAAAAAAGKAADDNAKKDLNEQAEKEAKEKGESEPSKEAELLSEEYYAAAKAKRRGLGLVRFIGELYRLQMLTERIMHECIKKLLANTDNPDEEDVESLCRLLTTVGKHLDNAKAKQHMDIYFQRMHTIANNPKTPSRMRFMILDVADLRSNYWQPRHDSAGPKLISEIHSDAQRAAEESSRRVASSGGKGLPRLNDQLSRPNSRRGQGRDGFGAPAADGWSQPVPQRPTKAGDLSAFGKTRENAAPITFGPTGAFAAKANKAKEAARPATPSNPFALLSGGGSDSAAEASTSQRPKLNLAPRTKPLDGESSAQADGIQNEDGAADEDEHAGQKDDDADDGAIDPNAISMSRSEAERRSGNSVKEFFSVKSIAEGTASVEALPSEYRGILIAALADAAVDKKADDVNITRQLFSDVSTKNIVRHQVMLDSLHSLVTGLIDLSVDVPNIYTFAASLLMGAQATREEVETMAQSMLSEEDDDEEELERGRQQLYAAFEKASGV